MIDRTVQLEKEPWNGKTRTGQPEKEIQDGISGTGQADKKAKLDRQKENRQARRISQEGIH
jgi:hypothetical protein